MDNKKKEKIHKIRDRLKKYKHPRCSTCQLFKEILDIIKDNEDKLDKEYKEFSEKSKADFLRRKKEDYSNE